jgi:hypothetical protein
MALLVRRAWPTSVGALSLVLTLVAIGPLATHAQDVAADEREMVLAVGQTASIRCSDVVSYSLSTPGPVQIRIRRIEDGEAWCEVRGVRDGTTTLLFLRADGSSVRYTFVVGSTPPGMTRRLYTLRVGEVIDVPVTGATSLSSTGPALVEVEVVADHLRVRGMARGSTTLSVANAAGETELLRFEVQ